MLVLVYRSTMGMGACIYSITDVPYGCGCLHTGVTWVWVLLKVHHGCRCLYTCVPWMLVLVFTCTLGVGACKQVYHGFGCL